MIKRRFHTYSEAIDELATTDESLRQAMLDRRIQPYIELDGEGFAYAKPDSNGKYPESGSSVIASWTDADTWPGNIENGWPFRLEGWFKLQQTEVNAICRSGGISGIRWIVGESDIPDIPPIKFEMELDLSRRSLWFSATDIESLKPANKATTEITKAIDDRERTTLLCIIGAMAGQSDIDLGKPYKAGEQIEAMLIANGIKVSSRTIGDHLKLVSDALESRKR